MDVRLVYMYCMCVIWHRGIASDSEKWLGIRWTFEMVIGLKL